MKRVKRKFIFSVQYVAFEVTKLQSGPWNLATGHIQRQSRLCYRLSPADLSPVIVCMLNLLLLPGAELPSWKFWPSQRPLSTSLDPGRRLSRFLMFIWQMSCLMLSSHLYLGLPCDLLVRGFQLNIFLTVLVSGILCTWPNQLSLWALM